jgi:NTE family protein
MLAVVLSGGGNYGAMQAGALEALAGSKIRPAIVVGTSAGALNAIHFASDPSVEGARRQQAIWRHVDQGMVGSLSLLGGLQRLVTNQPSLFTNQALAQFVEDNLPLGATTFGDLRQLAGVRAYTLSACLDSGELVVFGDRDADRLLDGAMASSSLPPYLPPWMAAGRRYVDGAVYSNLPIRTAVERGATQIIALEVHHAVASSRASRFMIDITNAALSLMVEHMADAEERWARRHRIPVRRIHLDAPPEVPFWDYSKTDLLIDAGRQIMAQTLERDPIKLAPEWQVRLQQALAGWIPGKD